MFANGKNTHFSPKSDNETKGKGINGHTTYGSQTGGLSERCKEVR